MSRAIDGARAPRKLWELSAVEVAERVRSGRTTARAVVEACLERTVKTEGRLSAYVAIEQDGALERADAIDRGLAAERLGGGEPVSAALPLAGVPVALKDNISVAGRPLSCGSRLLEGYVAPFTATVVERLLAAGAVPVGRTNLDEFAMGSSCETSAFGPTRNPWAPDRVAGGSSGGSAAAVASSGVPLAFGSDTGGSVRQPAALCGVVGLRPTRGRVSRWGLVAFASSMDQVGPLARTVRDAGAALAVIAGPDPHDVTCVERSADDVREALDRLDEGIEGWRVGTVHELGELDLPPAVAEDHRAALERLASAGAEIVELSVRGAERALAAYTVIAAAEASSNLARFDGVRFGRRAAAGDAARTVAASRDEGFGAEVRRRVLLGTFALSAGYAERYYGRAREARAALSRRFAAAFEEVDVIATPTAPSGAFPLGSRLDDPVTMYRSDLLTAPPSLCGLPAVSVPSGLDADGLPLGLQLVAPRFAEGRLLRAARAFERATQSGRLRAGGTNAQTDRISTAGSA